MQCNQPLCCIGYPNCGHQYAYNCSAGPQWFTNPAPMPTFPCIAPPRSNPEVIGEGEVTTVVLPDGTTQLYFLPLTKWCKPQTFNPNPQLFGNSFQNTNCEIWFIRNVSKTTPLPFPYCNSNPVCCPQPQVPQVQQVCCNVPCYPALCNDTKFHNDGWTSTTDLKYFCPGIRCTVCAVLPSKCISVQTSLRCNRGVASKSCQQTPSCCNAKCSYDNILLCPPTMLRDSICSPASCMSIEETEPKRATGRARRGRNISSSDCSSISACSLSCVSFKCIEKCRHNTKDAKNSRKFQKKSEPCCCAAAREKSNKDRDICSECGATDELCSFCNQTENISKKNINVQCPVTETSASECCDSVRGDDCTVIKETRMIPSSCSNSTINSALDYRAELWIPKTEKCERMEWCNCKKTAGRRGACCSRGGCNP